METIVKQSADGIILSRDNNFDTNLGKLFINNHEITDIDTFFKVTEENTKLINQQKEFINYLENHIKQMVDDYVSFKYDKTSVTSGEYKAYKEILRKYKSIIGDDK